MKTIKCILLGIFLCFFCNLVNAEESSFAGKWYKIEVVVFSQLSRQALNSEQWPVVNPEFFTGNNIIQLNKENNPYTNYVLLPEHHYSLNSEVRELNRQPNYHVILHLAWKQKISEPDQAQPVHIFGGNIQGNPSETNNSLFANLDYALIKPWQVDGTVTVSVQRYFDVKLNLYFALPAAMLAKSSSTGYFPDIHKGVVYFHLLQDRRMRSNELNYVSHPLYGVLIKIVRMD